MHGSKGRAAAWLAAAGAAAVRLAMPWLLMALLSLAMAPAAQAQTYYVTNTNDSGAGSLRAEITLANASGGTITFSPLLDGMTIVAGSTANGPLPAIDNDVTINGTAAGATGITLSGGSANRVFFVQSGTVTIENLTIANGLAQGGAGGSGQNGGGGGLGAGAAIFVNTGTTTVTNVTFSNNTATGGAGGAGSGTSFVGGGGGGGLGGNGGNGGEGAGGGGGYSGGGGGGGGFNNTLVTTSPGNGGTGPGGNGGNGGAGPGSPPNNGANGGAGTIGSSVTAGGGGSGGINAGGGGGGGGVNGGMGGGGNALQGGGGGGGGAGLTGAGGGGNGGAGGVGGGGAGGVGASSSGASSGSTGGMGGDFGGGGGNAGHGGFGGGGGGDQTSGGGGGFGGGGGGGGTTGGTGGTGAGSGASTAAAGGGGGAALGGAVFVRDGATLNIGAGSFSGSQVNAGSGSGGGTNGAAVGTDLFLQTGVTTTLNPSGATLTFNGTIADDSAKSLPSGQSYTAGTAAGAAIDVATANGGSVVLNNANTYSGGTTVSGGTTTAPSTLSISNSNALGSGRLSLGSTGADVTTLVLNGTGLTVANPVTVTGDPAIVVATGNTNTMSNVIGGAGDVVADGGGTLVLSGANTYSGGTTICGTARDTVCLSANATPTTATTLQVGASSVGGPAPAAITSGPLGTGTLTFDGGVLQGGGIGYTVANAIQINSTGGTIDANGAGFTLAGNITNGNATTGGLTIEDSTGDSYDVALGGTNTYSGPTTVDSNGQIQTESTGALSPNSAFTVNGLLSVFNNNTILSLAGSGTVRGSSTTLTIAPVSGTTTFSGTLRNVALAPFAIIKGGAGTQVFSGASNSYTGTTTINGGTLEIDGSIATSSLTSINATGTLDGIGTVGNTSVSGGVFAPGNGTPGSSQTVAGTLGFSSGGVYRVFLNPTMASMSTVAGTATLTGGTVNAQFAAGSYLTRDYEILAASALAGTFSGLTTANLPAGFVASLDYTHTDDVYLDLQAGLSGTTGLNGNQQSVANALSNYFNSGGALPPNFLSIFGLSGPALANALSQLDGEAATGAEHSVFQLMTEFLDLMLDPSAAGGGGNGGSGAAGFAPETEASLPPDVALAYARALKKQTQQQQPQEFAQRWSAWGSGFGGSSTTNGDPTVGSNNLTASTYGYAGGLDYHVTPSTLYGFALAGGGTNWSLAQNLGGGRSDAFQAGVYGKTQMGPAYLSVALAVANHWFTTDRTAALGDQLQAKFDGQSYGGRAEAGYRYAVLPLAGITPYAALQVQDFRTPGYSETDLTGGGFGLSYTAMSATDTRSELGARADDLTMLGAMPLVLRGRLAWAHDWVSNPALGAAFEALPGASFTVNGAAIPRDSALATAAAELHLTANWTAMAKFDGEFASNSQTYAGTGTLRYTW
jgi:uncharacterized protein with beta-barrel porin domain